MADWKRLREERAAEEAERIAAASTGDYGATGDFGEAPPDPVSFDPYQSFSHLPKSAVSTMARGGPVPFVPESPQEKADQSWRFLNKEAAQQTAALPENRSALATAGEAAGQGLMGAMGHVGDVFAATPVGMAGLYGTQKVLGGREDTGTLGDEASAFRTALKPFSNVGKGLAELFGYKTDGGISERDTLQGQQVEKLGENFQSMVDPEAPWQERVASGVVGTLRLPALLSGGTRGMSTIPGTNIAPLQDAASLAMKGASKVARAAEGAGIANPTMTQLASGLGRTAQELLGVARSAQPGENLFDLAVRRGALGMPGKPTPTPKQQELIMRIATEEAKGDMDKFADYWTAGVLRIRELGDDPDAIRSAMRGFTLDDPAMKRSLRPLKEEYVEAKRPTVDESETLGLSDEASREILAGAPMEAKPEKVRRESYVPKTTTDADRAAALNRVEDALLEGGDPELFAADLGLLDRKRVVNLAKRFGDPQRNAGKAEAIIKEAFAAKAKEPTQPPTSAAGRQEAAELQMAERAEAVAERGARTPGEIDADAMVAKYGEQHRKPPQWKPEPGKNYGESFEEIIDNVVAERGGKAGMTPIHEIRNAVRAMIDDEAAGEPLTQYLKEAHQKPDGWRMVPISDRSRAPHGAMKDSIEGVGGREQTETLYWIEPREGRIAKYGTPVATPPQAIVPEGVRHGEAGGQIPAQGAAETGPAQAGRQVPAEPTPAAQPGQPQPGLGSGQQVVQQGAEPIPAAPTPSGTAGQPARQVIPTPPPPARAGSAAAGSPPQPPAGRQGIAAQSSEASRNRTGLALNHIDSLENASLKANNVAGRQLAEKGREIVNYGESNAASPVKELNDLGEMVMKNPAARNEVSELISPAMWKDLGAGDLRVGRFQANVDSNAAQMFIDPSEMAFTTKEAKDYASGYVKGMAETGDEAMRLGVKTPDGEPFVAKHERFIQQLDPSARDWMKDGDPTFEKLKTQLGAIYPEADLKAVGESLKSMAAQSLDRPAAFEFVREIPMLPAAIVDDTGKLRPILKHDVLPTSVNPRNPVAGIVESQWMRLGGIKHLGQDVLDAVVNTADNATGMIAETPLGAALQSGGEDVVHAAKGMLGAIYHRPEAGTMFNKSMSDTWLMKSRDKAAQILRPILRRVVPAMNLSRVWAVSSPQTLGEVAAVTGAFNYAKAVAKVLANPKMTFEAAEAAGAVHRKFLMQGSKLWDQHRPLESLISGIANRFPTESLNEFVKDWNDVIPFTAGEFKAEEMLTKGVKQSDLLMMDEMNLPQSVQSVFRNPAGFDAAAKRAATESFSRSVAKHTQFHSKNAALKGRIENDQVLRWVMPYQSYSINTLKRTVKDFERVWNASKVGAKDEGNFIQKTFSRLNPFGSERETFRNSLDRLAKRLVGMELAGEVVADISAAGQGKDPMRSDRSAAARMLENLSYVGFLGPAHFIFDMATAHLLGDEDKDYKKRSLTGRVGSRVPEVGNPAGGAALKAGTKALKGDIGGAAWELTGGQMPIISNLGRATGVMEPAGTTSNTAASSGGGRNPFSVNRPANPFSANKPKNPFSQNKKKNPFGRNRND